MKLLARGTPNLCVCFIKTDNFIHQPDYNVEVRDERPLPERIESLKRHKNMVNAREIHQKQQSENSLLTIYATQKVGNSLLNTILQKEIDE